MEKPYLQRYLHGWSDAVWGGGGGGGGNYFLDFFAVTVLRRQNCVYLNSWASGMMANVLSVILFNHESMISFQLSKSVRNWSFFCEKASI